VEPAAPATRAVGGTLDRWFELTSIVPLSAFALLHVVRYGLSLGGFVEVGERASPALVWRVLEVLVVWAPLLAHSALSPWVYARRRQERTPGPSLAASLVVHRLAGPVLALFLVDHFVRFRWPIVRGVRYPAESLGALAAELSRTTAGVPFVAGFHGLGLLALAFHLSFGLWRVASRYPERIAPRTASWVCAGIGVLTAVVGTWTIIRLAAG
jgi:succinate dehydrogenase/fumarate reductase cytochrome b subunit